MKKALILTQLVLISIFFSACSLFNRGTPKVADDYKTEIKPKEFELSDFKGNILELLQMNANVTCTYTNNSDKATSTGTVYTAKNRSRMDAVSTYEKDLTMNTHSVTKDGWMYVWTEGQPKGIKLNTEKAKENAEKYGNEEITKKAMEDVQQNYDYKCAPWNVDESKFEVPTDIEFVDMEEALKQIKDTLGTLCTSCNKAPNEEAKQMCREKLGCTN